MHNKIYSNITETIGNTSLVYLSRLTAGCLASIAVKLESVNPMSGVKDRMALSMIDDAERSGRLKPGTELALPLLQLQKAIN